MLRRASTSRLAASLAASCTALVFVLMRWSLPSCSSASHDLLRAPPHRPMPPPATDNVAATRHRGDSRRRAARRTSLSARAIPPFYDVLGKRYFVLPTAEGYVERGVASWYGPGFHEATHFERRAVRHVRHDCGTQDAAAALLRAGHESAQRAQRDVARQRSRSVQGWTHHRSVLHRRRKARHPARRHCLRRGPRTDARHDVATDSCLPAKRTVRTGWRFRSAGECIEAAGAAAHTGHRRRASCAKIRSTASRCSAYASVRFRPSPSSIASSHG